MEFIVAMVAALVPAVVLILAPREWFKTLAGIAVILFVLGVVWTVSFGNSCQSDGCIGVFLIGAITATLGVSSAIAAAIRWAMIAGRGDHNSPEE